MHLSCEGSYKIEVLLSCAEYMSLLNEYYIEKQLQDESEIVLYIIISLRNNKSKLKIWMREKLNC
jgi:hypothetical protein